MRSWKSHVQYLLCHTHKHLKLSLNVPTTTGALAPGYRCWVNKRRWWWKQKSRNDLLGWRNRLITSDEGNTMHRNFLLWGRGSIRLLWEVQFETWCLWGDRRPSLWRALSQKIDVPNSLSHCLVWSLWKHLQRLSVTPKGNIMVQNKHLHLGWQLYREKG